MRAIFLISLSVVTVAAIACGVTPIRAAAGTASASPTPDAYKKEIDAWHQGRIDRLMKEDGWLTLVGLFPLKDGVHTFGSAHDNDIVFPSRAPAHAGRLIVMRGKVHMESTGAAAMSHGDIPIRGIDMVSDAKGDPTEVTMGSFKFYVIDRTGSLYLRVKDAESPVRLHFKDIPRYPVDEKWRVEAHLVPYNPPRKLVVPDALGVNEIVECRGALAFHVNGKEYRLEPMSEEDGEMFVVFGDKTSGVDTYGGGRFVYVDSPDSTGKTYIDFNKAYNPPCVFTEFATCPLPHPDNILPFPVLAGEKLWKEGH